MMISHTSALELLRSWDLRRQLTASARIDPVVPERAPTAGELRAAAERSRQLAGLSRPLHVLVSRPEGRVRGVGVCSHLCRAPLPRGSAIGLGDGLTCVGPEQLVVQMATTLSELELAVLLSELMGLYAIEPGLGRGMYQRDVPLTTPELVAAHLDAMGHVAGSAKARRSLRLACVESGSPRETRLSLRLGLGARAGGYGLEVLSMNEPLEVRRISQLLPPGIRKPDILLRAPSAVRGDGPLTGVAFEYAGSDHDDPGRRARDEARANELLALGLKDYVVGAQAYHDLDYMDGLVAQARRDLGAPARRPTREEAARARARRRRLHDELELIDGVTWGRRLPEAQGAERPGEGWDVVPLEAYGL